MPEWVPLKRWDKKQAAAYVSRIMREGNVSVKEWAVELRPPLPLPRPAPPPRPAPDDFIPGTALLVGGPLPFKYAAVSGEWLTERRKEAKTRARIGDYGSTPGTGE